MIKHTMLLIVTWIILRYPYQMAKATLKISLTSRIFWRFGSVLERPKVSAWTSAWSFSIAGPTVTKPKIGFASIPPTEFSLRGYAPETYGFLDEALPTLSIGTVAVATLLLHSRTSLTLVRTISRSSLRKVLRSVDARRADRIFRLRKNQCYENRFWRRFFYFSSRGSRTQRYLPFRRLTLTRFCRSSVYFSKLATGKLHAYRNACHLDCAAIAPVDSSSNVQLLKIPCLMDNVPRSSVKIEG
jgi:hypothetical protein